MASAALADQKSLTYLLGSLEQAQQKYVYARALGASPVAAAQSAGYSSPVDAATDLEQNLMVRSAIEYSLRVKAKESQLTREDVLSGMMDAVRTSASAFELVAAWREIGKIVGAYAPQKIDINVAGGFTPEQLQSLDDHELIKLAAIDAEFVELRDTPDNPTPGDDVL